MSVGRLLGDLDGCFVGKEDGGEVGFGLGWPVSCSGMTIADEGIVDGESDAGKFALPELVPVPPTDTTAIDPARVVVPSPPSIATPPPLVEPSPELRLRVKLPLLLVDDQLPQFGSKAEVEGLGVASRLSFASRLNNIGMTIPVRTDKG